MQDKKVDIRSPSKFDVEFRGVICKGHVNNLAATVKYVCKEGDVITDMKNLFQGRLLTKNELVREIADKEGVEAALRYYGKSHPKTAMGGERLLNVERYLKRRVELDRVQQQKQYLNCRTILISKVAKMARLRLQTKINTGRYGRFW